MSEAYKLWINGEEREGRGELIDVEDPSTGEIFAQSHTASTEDVDEAVQACQAAYESGVWSRAPRQQRADVLERCATELTGALAPLIALEVQQTGRAMAEMQAQVPSLVRWFRYYAALLRTEEQPVLPTSGKLHNFVTRAPLGVVVQITSFNHPLLIAVKKLAPALAAGNSVIVKPSELTPLTTLLLGRLLQRAGLPDGVLAVLPGLGVTTGASLAAHPLVRKVDVTGGTTAGRAIGRLVGQNLARYTAELGGKAPLLVFADADVHAAVNGIAFASFVASGQTCVASTRILVANSILDSLLVRLAAKVASITRRIGRPANPASAMGPLISARQLARVESLVDDALASGLAVPLDTGETTACRMRGPSSLDGADLGLGYYYAPTVLLSTDRAANSITRTTLWREEAFGPVIVVVGFDSEDQAIALANDSPYGLGAAVWTTDLARAMRVTDRIDAGITWVNTHHRNDPSSPWGGAKKDSGVGSENGVDAYHAYTTMKSTVINFASTEEALATEDWFGEKAAPVRYG
ncbi:aldehyde dehydrogenase family [Grosmannia clavigera kw1407]|uniref:aldehyde dehydrogenase (NAD(+)) n=1 Tax=Grosmannia clavigera (strain kw1407 / UAMH 11150) TaxID=655863 RepID=F0XC23_GROCL|nr:aldehyde dehydrogenase family [Grosmannia clavigera kw1407]EFX03537.1 aldehyde dehydrogenase family [Grosmannia clavigera kw1407]